MFVEIIKEVDLDGNGEIDFKEFSVMMQKLIVEGESCTSGGASGSTLNMNNN